MGVEQLTALAARLRAIPELGAAIAKEAAAGVLAAAQATASAGTTPEGEAWAPRKADGSRALAKAASALSVRTEGDVIYIVLSGFKYIFNDRKRRILPAFGTRIPPAIVEAIRVAARKVIARAP